MILVPGGKKCYCGKQGCADAYCAASVLTDDTKETLEQFMKKVEEQDGQAVKVWKEYLNNLAILISNLRMEYDMDIILGGEVGGYLTEYMIPLGEKIMEFMKKLPEEYKENFRYTEKENKGLADTKNVGIELSRGKFISVVDSDDYISDDFYKIARRYVNDYDIIIYDVYVVFEKDKKLNYVSRAKSDWKENTKVALMNGAISGSSCNKIIKKDLYN